MEKEPYQLDLFAEQKQCKPPQPSPPKKESKVIAMKDYERMKQRQRIIEWTLKNVPSF